MEENLLGIDSLPEVPQQDMQEQPEIQVQEVQQPAVQKPDPQESFRQMRESKLRAERERDELMRKLNDIEASKQKTQNEETDYISIEPDALAEGKHLKKMEAKIKRLEQKIENSSKDALNMAIESRIKAKYPDFEKIASSENVAALREQYPELAHTLNSSSDLYTTAVSAYTMIKKLGISQEEDSYMNDKQKAQLNAAKPRPLTSVSPQQGDSPLSRANAFANGLTEELKTQLRKEMEEARKNR